MASVKAFPMKASEISVGHHTGSLRTTRWTSLMAFAHGPSQSVSPAFCDALNGEQYLGDESARLRFLREARAAASVRHPNVASVFHLGRTDENYFYAMEFVEGQTLESLIRSSGRLEVKLALEIASQVTGH
jgi:serine/threonine protein kinase